SSPPPAPPPHTWFHPRPPPPRSLSTPADPPPPPAAWVTDAPGGRDTGTGVAESVVVPFPSCPASFRPDASPPPAEVTARLWSYPAEIPVTRLPEGSDMVTGLASLAGLSPLPSWPLLSCPQPSTD